MVRRYENHCRLDADVKDAWGIPVLRFPCVHGDNEKAIWADAVETMKEAMTKAGGEITAVGGRISTPGGLIHEVGTCCMGDDPKTSVLNPFCQMNDIKNVYVFGGGPFVTTGSYRPTLTMMAATVRGCEQLVDQTKKRNI